MSKTKRIIIGIVVAVAVILVLLERNSRASDLPDDIMWGDSYSTIMEKLEEAEPAGGVVEYEEEGPFGKERVICASEFKFMGYISRLEYHVDEGKSLYKIEIEPIEEYLGFDFHPVTFHKKMERTLGPGEDISGDRDDYFYKWEKEDTVIILSYPYDDWDVSVYMWDKDVYYDEHPYEISEE